MTNPLSTGRAAEFLPILEDRLPGKTLRHVLSVTELIVSIHEEAGITEDRVLCAGLLHDLCKAMQGPALLRKAEEYSIAITDAQRERPGLLHGPVAAEESRRVLGVTDPDVYDAIYWHTTGRAHWCDTGVALYFADFAERYRPRPEAAEARAILEREGYKPAVRYVVEAKLGYVAEKYGLDDTTIEFRDWIRHSWT